MIPKRSIHSKKENEKGERESVTSLVSFERERERERDVYSSFNAFQFLLERLQVQKTPRVEHLSRLGYTMLDLGDTYYLVYHG
jgi:hypothetical protein